MACLNKVLLIGNLGRDPELKMTPSGVKVANFSIATTEKGKDGVEKTEWHNIVVFKKLAEIVEKYIKKGSSVYVEGKLITRSWKDPTSDQKKYRTEIIGYQIQMLGGKSQESQYNYSDSSGKNAPSYNEPPPEGKLPF